MKLNKLILAAIALAIASAPAWSQTFDDDIYFDASKAKKTTGSTPEAKKKQPVEVAIYPSADTYSLQLTSSTRDVDEYNRRGFFAIPDTTRTDSIATNNLNGDAFANTRRIERFYNPEVVIENPDATVAEYYYTDQPVEVNIYVNNPYPNFGNSWFYDPWYYGSGLYMPWYYGGYYSPWSWGWGPSWSWSWNWGPSWGWGTPWGWDPFWAWGPSWGPAWGWTGPSWGWTGPAAPPSTRPQPSHGGNYAGSYRRAANAAGGRYVGSNGATGHRVPGTNSGSNWNINNVGSRPGTGGSSAYRPGASGSNRGGGSTFNATGRRPGSSVNNTQSGRQTQNSYTNRNNTNTYNRSTENNHSTYRSNSGSFGGGGNSGSFNGGSSGGGGGSYRGGAGGAGGGGRRR